MFPFLVIAAAIGGLVWWGKSRQQSNTSAPTPAGNPPGYWPSTNLPKTWNDAGKNLGTTQIENCVVTYSDGSKKPCVNPLDIDKAIQAAAAGRQVGVIFIIGRNAAGDSPTGLIGERYTVEGTILGATIGEDGKRYTGVAVRNNIEWDDGSPAVTKGQILLLSDWNYETITGMA